MKKERNKKGIKNKQKSKQKLKELIIQLEGFFRSVKMENKIIGR